MSEVTHKQIVIVEGPAGSGKSTFLERMTRFSEGVTVVSGSLGKRSFADEVEAGVKSFYNDIGKVQMALSSTSKVVFIDRCFISQQVYHCIRTNQDLPQMKCLFQQWYRLILLLSQDLHSRLTLAHHQEPILELLYLFLIPSVRQLRARRKTGGKDYPNSAALEVQLYKDVARHAAVNNPFVTIPAYETLEDQDNLVDGFERWMNDLDDEVWACDLWKSLAPPTLRYTIYGFRCSQCYIQSGSSSTNPEDAPTCCDNMKMTPYKIER